MSRPYESLRATLSSHNYFLVHFSLIKMMGSFEKGGFFQYLINASHRFKANDGFFYCTVDRVVDELYMSERHIRKCVKELEEDGWIKIKWRGQPGKRYFQINFAKINDFLSGEVGQTTSGGVERNPSLGMNDNPRIPDEHTVNNKSISNKKPRSSKRTSRGGKQVAAPSTLHTKEFDVKAAAVLRGILVENNSDLTTSSKNHRAARLQTLTKSITRLRLDRHVSEEEITGMLRWLELHYGDQYVPKMYRAADLYNNWERFKDAKARLIADSNGGVKKAPNHAKKMLLRSNVLEWLLDRGAIDDTYDVVSPAMVKRALRALGREPDAITEMFVNSHGEEE